MRLGIFEKICPDALITFHERPYISYQEITLTKNARLYFTGILRSETVLVKVFQDHHINKSLKL